MDEIIAKLRKVLHMKREDNSFTFCGKKVIDNEKGITVSQRGAAAAIEPLNFVGTPDRLITEDERSEYRSAVGKLMWIQGQSRPDLSFGSSKCAQATTRATVADARFVDQVIVRTKENKDYSLLFPRGAVDMRRTAIVAYGDTAFANMDDANSQCGFTATLVDARTAVAGTAPNENTGRIPLFWRSATIKRKVRSTMAAEAYAISETAETA